MKPGAVSSPQVRIAPPSTLVALQHADVPAPAREQRRARQGVDAGTHEDRVKARHGAEDTTRQWPVYMIKRMLLREVEYARPGSIEEAVRLLGAHDGARALAGGQTLVNVMKARAASPEVLVDLADLAELRDDRALGRRQALELGAMVTYSELVALARGRRRAAAPGRGRARRSPTARCRTAAPSAATSASTIRPTTCRRCSRPWARRSRSSGPDGERTVPADDFFLGVYMTAVGEGELLTRVNVPRSRPAAATPWRASRSACTAPTS